MYENEDKSKIALVMTKWVDIGAGTSPDDRKWAIRSHAAPIVRGRTTALEFDDDDTSQSARVCFEGSTQLSLDDLVSRNLSYIEDQRYKHYAYKLGEESDKDLEKKSDEDEDEDERSETWIIRKNVPCEDTSLGVAEIILVSLYITFL
ncbi:hypothetical protein N7456_000237 [Penicillium angulare]|uniref:Uncharacterized protein n=1 Tax=Penicillium angulare TaxID=116970 RepID=A0A9W9GBM9_9EURO|nr:hypothetical protein N7456_000237 [Penicillium angulare]